MELTIEVRQQRDEYCRCARPIVKDAFGNVLAVLSPKSETSAVGASYQYAFFAAAKGRYTVVLDNQECSVRLTAADATVTWTVHSP